ncbi:hypothetical protein I204_02748 [Kwoniella mangroviensis CBS 8886]|nr:hypothetical protein I204_02748 [Kwoniella mangroviensis CBS 8886]
MQAPLARQVAKYLSLQAGPPLCSKCLRPIQQQIRHHSSRISSPQRVRKTSSEFSSRNRDRDRDSYITLPGPSPSRSELSATDEALRENFDVIFSSSSSSSSSTPHRDIPKIVEAVYPLIFRRDLKSLLDGHLEQISISLSSTPDNNRFTNEQLRQAITILNHCWARSILLNFPIEKQELLEKIYAEFIIRQALISNKDVVQWISEVLESFLEKRSNSDLPISRKTSVVWAVLRTKLGILEQPKFPFIVDSSAKQDGKDQLKEFLGPFGEDVDLYIEQLQNLLEWSHRYEWSLKRINKEIHALRRQEDYEGIIALWEKFKLQISSDGKNLETPKKNDILSLFLLTFKRSTTPSRSLEAQFTDVLKHCTKPYPRNITQALLALRDRSDDKTTNADAKVGQEVLSLDHEDTQRSRSGNVLENMKSIWKETKEKDLKMYMIYLDGLGRLGDLAGLKEAWIELVKDQRAKEIYIKEEKLDLSTPFPPTQALNQMISSCLLVPDGPAVALDLFAQAVSPTSSIPINLITINTILRHHARQGDLSSMSSLFILAEKLNLKPDIITYTTLVQGLLRGGKIEIAKKVLEDMSQQGISPNERMFSMLISDLSKIGTVKSLSHAEELLNLMIKSKMRVNEVTWTGLISGYFKNGWIQNGWDTIKRMERNGMRLNRIGYNICFKEYTTAGEGGQGGITRLWDKMIKSGISPNSDSYLLVLTTLIHQKNWQDADKVLDEMKRRGFKAEKGALQTIVNRVKCRR